MFFSNNAHDFSDPFPHSSRTFREEEDDNTRWNEYPFKPVAQVHWEQQVAAASLAAAKVDINHDPKLTTDVRPRLFDHNSNQWMLLDTGAAISCYPRSYFPDAVVDHSRSLQAVNGTKIATFGQRNVKINLGGRTFNHNFILADQISEPICGWDMLLAFRLDLVWTKDNQCQLKDARANRTFPVYMRRANKSDVGLALVTFKQYAAEQKVRDKEPEIPIPPDYKHIVDEFPKILEVNLIKIPKHNVVHTIQTGSNAPCRAKLRKIMPGTPKYVQGEKAWRELEQLGVMEKVGPRETNQWSSALHLLMKADGTMRPCGDYRALNDRTLLDVYPLPRLNDFTAKLRDCQVFSTIDLLKSYHQIPLDGPSSNKTMLLTPYGNYRFRRLAMGLKNSAQRFQKLMNFVLDGLDNVFSYLDDILVFNKDDIQHKKVIRALFH